LIWCRQKFDVVLMNPPFGDASLPSKRTIDETYGDTKGDVYKAFVECFQDRSCRAGFWASFRAHGIFLERVERLARAYSTALVSSVVLADFGMGVLDAMVETAHTCCEV